MRWTAIATAAALAGCATTPEVRIADRLTDYGLSRRSAECMAEELTDRLSNRQLRTLADFARDVDRGRDMRRMTIGELVRDAARIGDPELVGAVTTAGVGCAVLGAGL